MAEFVEAISDKLEDLGLPRLPPIDITSASFDAIPPTWTPITSQLFAQVRLEVDSLCSSRTYVFLLSSGLFLERLELRSWFRRLVMGNTRRCGRTRPL